MNRIPIVDDIACKLEKKTAQLEEENRILGEQEALSHAILSSLSAHVAVLNERGDIILINEAWKNFATKNGGSPDLSLGVGVNYLDVCRSAYRASDSEAGAALDGIEEVLSGSLKEFEL